MLTDPTTAPTHAPDEVRERAVDLLSRPPFADEEPGLVARFVEWLGDLVAGVLARIGGAVSAGGVLAWSIVLLGTVLLVLVVWRASRGLRTDRARVVAGPVVADRSAADWHAEADRAAARGDLHAAVRCCYGALVAHLVEGGVLDGRPGRTVRELDAEVADAAPRLADDVGAASRRFEAIRYGAAAATEDDLATVRDAAAAVVRALDRGRSASSRRAGDPAGVG